ncbi:Sedlin [Acaromyces ingoldii]|uniref:Sedlin n=1 Tax=Acaromyces ingoldii TaxID=215250 RepID=A0A316YQH3_9BASI|nr:Sedlin [Acaromyces ingoldii]PWN90283.1 Sedlin [Acaromyces ingoldii]
MSYYFCIVGTRDNPLYQADLASKPAGSSGPASFFSSSSSSSSSSSTSGSAGAGANQVSAGGSGGNGSDRRSVDSVASAGPGAGAGTGGSAGGGTSTTGGVFGFGNALGALAGGLGSGSSARTGPFGGQASGGGGASAPGSGGEGKGLGFGRYNDKHVLQMIAHSSLDVVEDKQFVNGAMYLKAVDRINEWTTSAFLAPGNIKLLILHEHKHDDGIRNFFYDVWELVVKTMMNPFHDANAPIDSPTFDAKVRASARKHL